MARKPRARYLQVKGWWDFQHYPDKVENGWTPTFIKTYTALLDDYDYNALSEVDRGRLHRIWLLAARLNNKIPWDERFVRTAIRASSSFKLATFIATGMLLEWDENAATRPPDKRRKPRNQAKDALDKLLGDSMPEQSRAEKKREETATAFEEVEEVNQTFPRSLPIDVEKRLELEKMLPYLHDRDEGSLGVLEATARGLSMGSICKVRESVQNASKRVGVGYAVNALKLEAKEAA
jgi:hypothetical protein